MVSQSGPDDLKRELQATFAARREIGPMYDEHFINALTEKLTTQIQQQVERQVQRSTLRTSPSRRPSHGKRIVFAISSLIFGIPIVIVGANLGMAGFLAACLLLLGLNVAFALLP